jgi:parallel beta-helix repeat protein
MKRFLVVIIIISFVSAGIIPATVGVIEKNNSQSNHRTGGYIQGLIDNATAGNTINVPSGTYYENVIINKSISLIGEDKNTTILDGGGTGDVVYISADWVNISEFTLRNGDDHGVYIYSDYNTIISTIILNNERGLALNSGSGNTIIDNVFKSNTYGGIYLASSYENTISNNTIDANNWDGIYLVVSGSNTIAGNYISNNNNGISLRASSNNTVSGNSILGNKYGLYLTWRIIFHHLMHSSSNKILSNNFLENNQDVFFRGGILTKKNTWDNNYWRRPRLLPKLIIGVITPFEGSVTIPLMIPWINIDWRPAQEPYDIG